MRGGRLFRRFYRVIFPLEKITYDAPYSLTLFFVVESLCGLAYIGNAVTEGNA